MKSIYIHIPFCHHICHYCDFNKVFLKNQPVDQYVDALLREIEMVSPLLIEPVETIFIGGGTPTALSAKQLERLMLGIEKFIPISSDVEFTIEANPGDISADQLSVLRAGGVNRVSLGVQSFDTGLLEKIGRTHREKEVRETIDLLTNNGFTNISIDVMYGLPGQTMDQWKDTLKKAVQLELPHFSAYSLIVEPKTVFYNMHRKGRLSLPPQELEADMYREVMDVFSQHGLHQYEISNFAQKGFESKHNKVYWDNEEYIGLGAGAHGYELGKRLSNIGPVNQYIKAVENGNRPTNHTHEVTRVERMEEEMFLGLRKVEGVSAARFYEKFGVQLVDVFHSPIEEAIGEGLLQSDEVGVRLTDKGRFLGNQVFEKFIGVIE
ncbi:radical SAM family heme chaperone HemW [Mangrovibacillus cuniculi]|uniref:Heme chaperone HemW n=1 Tax=Mangrovibacillus cuniculi TaxID=2593652 RepID=A0A7S8HFI3_9BACI|nr:radical SAM family heme chaperone HemW [Mangrovibacillus cuniculi]QPC46939.1 oxygen-independent coproporphyrinogen III oxidase [Mangrovibacillus cuniculi]